MLLFCRRPYGGLEVLDCSATGPINLEDPNGLTIRDLADLVIERTGSAPVLKRYPLPADDPTTRCSNAGLAAGVLGSIPTTSLINGLDMTVAWQRSVNAPLGGRQ